VQQTFRKLRVKDQLRGDLVTEPGHLPLRIAACRALPGGNRLGERDFAAQMVQQLGQPDGFHRRQIRIEPAARERRRLGESAVLDHRGKARIAADVKPPARRQQQNRRRAVGRRRMRPAAPCPDWDPCRPHHLISTHQALRISGIKLAGGIRVETRQVLTKALAAERAVKRHRLLPDCFRYLGNGGQPQRQRAQVEPGSADDDRQPAGSRCRRDLGLSQRVPATDGAALGGIEKAVEPMRRPGAIGNVGAGGQDLQVTVTLQAVGVDHRSGERFCQAQGQRRFAARGRAGDHHDRRRQRRIDSKRLVANRLRGVGRTPMRIALTLIAGAAGTDLRHLAAAVAEALAIEADPVWLAPGEACDLVLDASDPRMIADTARSAVGGAAVDILAQPAVQRRKRLLVADLESTIIENEMLDELAMILGIGPRIGEITRRAMNAEIDFIAAIEARVALLAGIEATILEQAAARIRLTPGARILVATMRRDGAMTALVTGGFSVFAERVAAELGFDRIVANRLEIVGGRITGKVLPPIVTGETKRETLSDLAAERGIALTEILAVGDGANDVPMLTAAGLGVAFRAKPAVTAVARWRLDYSDLTGLLYAQGYRKTGFVA
jgi:phosphoserine phosphatase